MSSEPIRDPVKDHLLTPHNAALIVIDYQPVQVNSIAFRHRARNGPAPYRAGGCARTHARKRLPRIVKGALP